MKENNSNWSQIPNHSYKILIIAVSWSGNTNLLFNLVSKQPFIDKLYLYAYMLKIHMKQNINLNDSKAFI